MPIENLKDSFLLYTEQSELIEQLSNEQAGELFKGLFKYVSTGKVPNLDAMSRLVFTSIRQDLDRNAEKYEEIVEKRRIAGSKGGLKRAENLKNQTNEDTFQANAKFAKTNCSKSSYYDNVNENVHVNENENENVSLSYSEREGKYNGDNKGERERGKYKEGINSACSENTISEDDRQKLINYVTKKKLANKDVNAYVSRIIQNGDYEMILSEINSAPPPKAREEIIREELASIHDRKSALKVIVPYYTRGEPGANISSVLADYKIGSEIQKEFCEIMLKYDLDTYDKAIEYSWELSRLKVQEGIPPPAPL